MFGGKIRHIQLFHEVSQAFVANIVPLLTYRKMKAD
jgi:hypothetical protein